MEQVFIGGNYDELVNLFGPDESRRSYISHPDQLRGLQGVKVNRVGTYELRPVKERRAFEEEIREIEFRNKYEKGGLHEHN